MRDPDRAWEYGSREIGREASADAFIPPGAYVCCECECTCWFDEEPPREIEQEWEVSGVGSGTSTEYLCPHCCLMDDPPW